MVFKKKEPEPTPPSPQGVPEKKQEAFVIGFTARLTMNGWVVQEQYNDGVVEEFAFVGERAYETLGVYLFPNQPLPVVEEKKSGTLPVEDELRLTKEESALLDALQKKAGTRYTPPKDDVGEQL